MDTATVWTRSRRRRSAKVHAVSKFALFGVAILALAWPMTAAAGQASVEKSRWWRAYLAGSQPISLPDGRRINLYCEGDKAAGPVVIMEAGLGSGAWTWRTVHSHIAATARVCVYDRAGYFGRSSPAPGPRTVGAEADDLADLLDAARVPGPYVLVGHSYGGLIVRLFAFRNPASVAGLVLVDPSVEYQETRLSRLATTRMIAEREASDARTRHCATEATRKPGDCVLRPVPGDLPSNLVGWFVQAQDAAYADTLIREGEALNADSSAQIVSERRSLGDIPVVLLERDLAKLPPGERTAEEIGVINGQSASWHELHGQILAGISTRASLRNVPGAGHRIQDDDPAAVVAAVREVLDAARKR